jgi:hypothetical protein
LPQDRPINPTPGFEPGTLHGVSILFQIFSARLNVSLQYKVLCVLSREKHYRNFRGGGNCQAVLLKVGFF